MATRVEEAYGERDQTVDAKGNVTEIEIPYLVFEVSDEDAALSAARSKAAGHTIKGRTWRLQAPPTQQWLLPHQSPQPLHL